MGMLIGISGKKQHGKDSIATLIQVIDGLSTGISQSGQLVFHPTDYIGQDLPLPRSRFNHLKFADTLKQMGCILLKCNMKDWEDPIFKDTPLGDEWKRYRVNFRIENQEGKEWMLYGFDEGELFATAEEANEYKSQIMEKCLNNKLNIDYLDIEEENLTPRYILQLLGTEGGRDLIHPNLWVNSVFANFNENSNWIISDVRFENEAEAIKKRGGVVIRVHRPGFHSSADNHSSETALDKYDKFDYFVLNDGTRYNLLEQVEKICTDLELVSTNYWNNLANAF